MVTLHLIAISTILPLAFGWSETLSLLWKVFFFSPSTGATVLFGSED
jgi:hypothetical protein